MKLSRKSTEYQSPAIGQYPATCVRVVDLGTTENKFKPEKGAYRQVRIYFELAGESVTTDATNLMQDGRPFLVSKTYTASWHEKANMRKHLEKWRGAPYTEAQIEEFETNGFDWKKMVGQHCSITMDVYVENDRVFLDEVGRAQKGWVFAPPVAETYVLDLDDFDPVIYHKLGDDIKKQIATSPEYKAAVDTRLDTSRQPAPASQQYDDEIPF